MPVSLTEIKYLLGTKTLMDLASAGREAGAWMNKLELQECALSLVSLGQALSFGEALDSTDPRKTPFLEHLQEIEEQFLQHEGLVGLDLDIAKRWSRIRHLPLKFKEKRNWHILNPDYGLILATAIEKNWILLEPPRAYHQTLKVMGLKTLDPDAL